MATTRVGIASHGNRVTPASNTRYAIAWTGQSYVLGEGAETELSTTQPYSNVRAVNATSSHGAQTPGLVALVTVNSDESLLEGSTNQLARLQGASGVQDFIVHHRALGGSTLSQIESGTGFFTNNIAQAADAVTAASPDSVIYVALCVNHGFTDETGDAGRADSTPDLAWATYQAGMMQMLLDYRSSIQTETGQTHDFPIVIAQLSFWQVSSATPIGATYALEQLRLGISNSDIYLAGPTYQYELGTDNLHLTARGYRANAEHWGCVLHDIIFGGYRWKPLHPLTARASGSTVTLRYFVPAVAFGHHTAGQAFLALDTGSYGWRGAAGSSTTHGFSYSPDVGSARTVTGVSLGSEYSDGTADVVVTLSGAAEVGGTINYITPSAAPPNHTVGNLRDNSNWVTESGDEAFNFACVSSTVIE